jgi:hypothetical protein
MLYRMIKPIFFTASQKNTPHVKQKRPAEDLQKKLQNKIEDADFEEVDD